MVQQGADVLYQILVTKAIKSDPMRHMLSASDRFKVSALNKECHQKMSGSLGHAKLSLVARNRELG